MTNKKKKTKKTYSLSKQMNAQLLNVANMDNKELLKSFNSKENGLDQDQYEKNLEQYGSNTIIAKKKHH